MIKFTLLTALFFMGSFAHASSIKASGATGAQSYSDFGLVANWSVGDKAAESKTAKSKSAKAAQGDEADDAEEKGPSILTSAESTKSLGTITNEYKLGYDSLINEITSYGLNGYFRTEPGNVKVIGFEPEFTFNYDSLIAKDLSTSFTVGLELGRTSTVTQLTPARQINQGFTSTGASLTVNQEIIQGVKASLGASFYHYTEPQTRFVVTRKKLVNLLPTDTSLSTSGYPDRTYSFGLSWDFAEKWSTDYNISRSKAHFDGSISANSSVGVDHTFSDHWATGLTYAWSSTAATSGSLDATYSW